ncbi:hypothetical protein [Tellurirhabdus bombi]|uniref:hypothetical protein n=1 Tax=Tellurirhabdus bombi TaxID=2907205 RepID=UPI001F3DBDC7|nr:hypothetical protein [Tellurirhabdus bombi]
MYLLTSEQIEALRNHVLRSGVSADLLTELTDHLACDLENAMWEGNSFETALDTVIQGADLKNMAQLQEEYDSILALPDSQPATLNDIVFLNRNKAYGAYDLRMQYSWAAERALLWGFLLFALAIFSLSWHVNHNVSHRRSESVKHAKVRFVEPEWMQTARKNTALMQKKADNQLKK